MGRHQNPEPADAAAVVVGQSLDLTDDQRQVYLTLAYYDARGVPDAKLVQIFRCSVEHLSEARQTEVYHEFLSAEIAQITNREAELDDCWDSLERQAVGALVDAVDTISDPRTLLGIAVKANVATRRAGNLAKAQQRHGPAVIDVNAQTGGTRVVRMRTRFLEALQDANGSRRLVERETEIVANDTGSLNEVISPQQMKGIMQRSLGVDTSDMVVRHRHGPDVDITLDFGDLEAE